MIRLWGVTITNIGWVTSDTVRGGWTKYTALPVKINSVTAGGLFVLLRQQLTPQTMVKSLSRHTCSPATQPCLHSLLHDITKRGQSPASRLAGGRRSADQVQRSQSCAKRWHQRAELNRWPRNAGMTLKQHPIEPAQKTANAAWHGLAPLRRPACRRGCDAAESRVVS